MADDHVVTIPVIDGPDGLQLMWSLMRYPAQNRHAVNAAIVTAVRFCVDADGYSLVGAYVLFATIDALARDGDSGYRWKVEGRVVEPAGFLTFSGAYDARSRAGILMLLRT